MEEPKHPNVAEKIEEAAAGQTIEGVVIGEFWRHKNDPNWPRVPKEKLGVLLSWPEAREMLDYEADMGFGGADHHPVVAWTRDLVVVAGEYDGSTWFEAVPRHPHNFDAKFIGGG